MQNPIELATNEYGPDRPPMMPLPHSNNPLPYQNKEGKKISALLSEELVRGGGVERVDEVGEHEGDDHQEVGDALVNRRACKTDRGNLSRELPAGCWGQNVAEARTERRTKRSGTRE